MLEAGAAQLQVDARVLAPAQRDYLQVRERDVMGRARLAGQDVGLRERMRMPGPDGKVMHAEMELADGVIMMGCPGADYKKSKRLGHVTQNLYVYVDDVDKHFQHAKAAGAKILAVNLTGVFHLIQAVIGP